MKEIFSDYLGISVMGALLICVVLLVRLLMKKSPRRIVCVLWAVVCLRLLLPFHMETTLSLQPSAPVIYQNIWGIDISTDLGTLRIPQTADPAENIPDFVPVRYDNDIVGRLMVDYMELGSWVWLGVTSAILLYSFVSFLIIKYRVRESVRICGDVHSVCGLDSAFLLGFFYPKIYLPAKLATEHMPYVIVHERAHKLRGDNWFKLLGFMCLAVHWFNPLVWIAYAVFCCDIEAACDEMVIRHMDSTERKNYSMALLDCSARSTGVLRCPVAFGEVDVKQRIKSVLNYRKPVLWGSILSVIVVLLVGVFFLTERDKIYQDYPEYFGVLYENLGQKREDVCTKLDELDFTWNEKDWYASAPVDIVYNDMHFSKLYLLFTKNEDMFYGFYYRTYLPNDDVENAIAELIDFAPKLNEDMLLHTPIVRAEPSKPEIILNKYNKGRQINDFSASWMMSIFPAQMQQWKLDLNKTGYDAYLLCSYGTRFFNEQDAPDVKNINVTLQFNLGKTSMGSANDDRNAKSPYDLDAVLSKVKTYAQEKGAVFSTEEFTGGSGQIERASADELGKNGGEDTLYQLMCELVDKEISFVQHDGYEPSECDFWIGIEYHKSDIYEYYDYYIYSYPRK